MPNDENNATTVGQTQSNPVNPSDTNPEMDFDFNFDVSEPVSQVMDDKDTISSANSTMAGLSSSVQSQIQRQGRSGMFLTPDEEVQKGNTVPLQMDNLDFAHSEPQTKTGMFTSPDDNTDVSSPVKDHGYADDDSYLAAIDPTDVEIDKKNEQLDSMENKNKEQDLDPELLDFMSFDDEKVSQNENVSPNDENLQNNDVLQDNIPQTEVISQNEQIPQDENISQNESVSQNDEISQNEETLQSGSIGGHQSGATDDRLAKEDQLVQDHFGDDLAEKVEDPVFVDINKSPQETIQAVDELVLQTENHGDDVITDNTGYVVSDTGNIESKSESYIPNENDFKNMSNLLNSAETGDVDMSKVADNLPEISPVEAQIVQNTENNQLDLDRMISNNIEVQTDVKPESQMSSEQEILPESQILSENVIPEIQQSVSPDPFNSQTILEQADHVEIQNQLEPQLSNELDSSVVVAQNVQNDPGLDQNIQNENSLDQNNSINLDDIQFSGLLPENKESVVNEAVVPSDQPMGGQLEFIADPHMISATPSMPKNKKKNPFLFVGMAVVFVLLGAIVLFKMFPDFFDNFNGIILGKPKVHYSANSDISSDLSGNLGTIENGITGDDQGLIGDESMDNEISDDTVENFDDLAGDNDQGQSEDIDPNSIFALLDDEKQIDDASGDDQGAMISAENNDGMGDAVQNGEINPFGELDGTLFGDNEYIQQMNNYISSGQYYYEMSQQMGNEGLQKYATFVIEQANSQLSNLEKGIEIDTSIVEKMDQILSKLESKIQGQ